MQNTNNEKYQKIILKMDYISQLLVTSAKPQFYILLLMQNNDMHGVTWNQNILPLEYWILVSYRSDL